MLDTNVISRLMREPEGGSASRLSRLGDDRVCTSVVVAGELRFGALLRGSERLISGVERVLASLPCSPSGNPRMNTTPTFVTELTVENWQRES